MMMKSYFDTKEELVIFAASVIGLTGTEHEGAALSFIGLVNSSYRWEIQGHKEFLSKIGRLEEFKRKGVRLRDAARMMADLPPKARAILQDVTRDTVTVYPVNIALLPFHDW